MNLFVEFIVKLLTLVIRHALDGGSGQRVEINFAHFIIIIIDICFWAANSGLICLQAVVFVGWNVHANLLYL